MPNRASKSAKPLPLEYGAEASGDRRLLRMRKPQEYPVVSLFSGAMGLDLGMIDAGLSVVVSQDYDRWCVETIRKNGHAAVEGDIRELLEDDPTCGFLLEPANIRAEDVFAVAGGPVQESRLSCGPCRRSFNRHSGIS